MTWSEPFPTLIEQSEESTLCQIEIQTLSWASQRISKQCQRKNRKKSKHQCQISLVHICKNREELKESLLGDWIRFEFASAFVGSARGRCSIETLIKRYRQSIIEESWDGFLRITEKSSRVSRETSWLSFMVACRIIREPLPRILNNAEKPSNTYNDSENTRSTVGMYEDLGHLEHDRVSQNSKTTYSSLLIRISRESWGTLKNLEGSWRILENLGESWRILKNSENNRSIRLVADR